MLAWQDSRARESEQEARSGGHPGSDSRRKPGKGLELFNLSDVQTALIAAVSAVITSLITISVNRWYDRKNRRYEWLLGKRAESVEEIVYKLDEFLKGFSERLEYIAAIHHASGLMFEMNSEGAYDPNFAETASTIILRSVQGSRENLRKETNLLWEEQTKRVKWFSHDSVRLSVWFYDAPKQRCLPLEVEGVQERLIKLGEQFNNIHFWLRDEINRTNEIYDRLLENSGKVTEDDVRRLQEQKSHIEELTERWGTVVKNTALLQRGLVGEIR